MKGTLKEYFYYSRIERNGAVILLTICVGLALSPTIYRLFHPKVTPQFVTSNALLAVAEIDTEPKATLVSTAAKTKAFSEGAETALFTFDPNEVSVEELMQLGLSSKVAHTIDNYREKGGSFRSPADLRKIYGLSESDFNRLRPYISLTTSKRKEQPITKQNSLERAAELFQFDPNQATQEEFERLGLSPKVARTIVNYRSKGGAFRQPADLQKIYGLSETDFNRLQTYISIPEPEEEVTELISLSVTETSVPSSYAAVASIDINSASAEEWQRLRGIGPTYSKRIVKFREALGGFAHVAQIADTYGLPDSTFQAIKPYLRVSSKPITLNINTVSEEELKKHPYISWKQAKVIVNYRSQHGSFSNLEEVAKVKVVSKEELDKLAPYLQFE